LSNFDSDADSPESKYPILNYLPNNDDSRYSFSVEPAFRDENDEDSFYISITADRLYRTSAVNWIDRIGFDPGDYEIEIDEFINPFTGGKI
jgi:hypothetical protein